MIFQEETRRKGKEERGRNGEDTGGKRPEADDERGRI